MTARTPTPIGMTMGELAGVWRSKAAELRSWGADSPAIALERAAGELEAVLQLAAGATLTLEEASRESGYSIDHLRHLVRDGAIPNAGAKGRPRIRRKDLPRKPSRAAAGSGRYDVDADALRLVSGRRS